MSYCSVQDVLLARDRRREMQEALLRRWGRPLLCFTMNIAGPNKRSALIDLAFRFGAEQLREAAGTFLFEQTEHCKAGSTFYAVLSADAAQTKALTVELENGSPVGRLFDMDILLANGKKLSRPQPRRCLICGGPVSICSRSRAHGLSVITAETARILQEFAADRLASLAVEALITEVHVTPKPGLVDENNTGSHSDMDIPLFEASARSLFPYFRQAAALGMESADCMPVLQDAGLRAEETMFDVTHGINTHKGVIYAFGLLLAGCGRFLVSGDDPFAAAAALAAKGKIPQTPTHGSIVRSRYHIPGAREEALAGFPHIQSALRLLQSGTAPEMVLLHLISECSDTNLYYRGGAEGYAFAVSAARSILKAAPERRHELLLEADDAFISRNLSPGGCADQLAAALFLHRSAILAP